MQLRDGRGHSLTIEQLTQHVGQGWAKLIVTLVHDLDALGWDGTILQCKEKFGGLRFYVSQTDDVIINRIGETERLSYLTCEQCGEPGVPRNGGWTKTLCDQHSDGRQPCNWA